MDTKDLNNSDHSHIGKLALFWDESFLWGIIAYNVFKELSINFDIVTAADIRDGVLGSYDILFVPGGWASNKNKALGKDGMDAIRSYIKNGGNYIGFCGGAGLALNHKDGLALVPVTRKPTKERVPSFSGKIRLSHGQAAHRMWHNIPDSSAFHAWWPGQFSINGNENITVVATYNEPENGSYVADLPINPSMDWDIWEAHYKTNLNPVRLKDEPAVIEAVYGRGKVLLSYLHFETPGDELGHKVLLNMFRHLSVKSIVLDGEGLFSDSSILLSSNQSAHHEALALVQELEARASDLIAFGQSNFLWYWRNSWIIQWRRGVRGIEYCTLYMMLKELSGRIAGANTIETQEAAREMPRALNDLKAFSLPFFDKAKQLLMLERLAMSNGPISPLESNDARIQEIREELFANSKSFGGYYKALIDQIDALLLLLIKSYPRKS